MATCRSNSQISFFDGAERFRIRKPIRLIELFAGYGSQNLALKYIGANYTSHAICEWAVKSIIAYKNLHCPDDSTEYSAQLSAEQVYQFLFQRGISADYSTPMTLEQIKRMGEDKCRYVYDCIKATNNYVSITNTHASDLGIVDTDKYCYLMTYSFPCQDLSVAGKLLGMKQDTGTRSGLLWQVKRLLDECKANKPQVLLMENVPNVHGTKNKQDFFAWCRYLESIGYHNYWQDLNAKCYGYPEPIPQNRDRCFMVSALGDNYYQFPNKTTLTKRLKDYLETDVPKQFYLSEKMVEYLRLTTIKNIKINNGNQYSGTDVDGCSKTITTKEGTRIKDNFIEEPVESCKIDLILNGGKWDKLHDICRRVYNTEYIAPAMVTCSGGNQEPKITEPIAYDEQNQCVRDDGTVGTLMTDGSSPKHNNRVIEPIGVVIPENNRNGYAIAIDGDSINTAYPNSTTRRGRVGKQISQTITTEDQIAVAVMEDGRIFRIRKLMPIECLRLMGVREDDIRRISIGQSNSSLYHLAGDSIVVNVLMAIFMEML